MPRLEDELALLEYISLDLPRSPYIALVPRLEDERRAEEVGDVILDWTERALAAVLEVYLRYISATSHLYLPISPLTCSRRTTASPPWPRGCAAAVSPIGSQPFSFS